MKPKNVMLLGFVNRAVEYLDRHMDDKPDARLTELKNIDLASLRDELIDNLDISLGTMQSTMSTLLKAGNEAFDNFIDSRANKHQSLSEQFDKMFDVDFDEKRTSNQDELAKLLSFYNLDSDIDIDENYLDSLNDQNIKDNDVISTKEATIDDISAEVSKQDYDDTEEFMKEIIKNVGEKIERDDSTNKTNDKKSSKDIDDIFNEIINNETPSTNDEKPIVEEQIYGIEEEETPNYVSSLIDDLREKMLKEDELVSKQEEFTPVINKPEQQSDGSTYVSSLIDDLKEQLAKEEEDKKQSQFRTKEVYERIAKIYPYLPTGFIRSVYDLKEPIAKAYPFDIQIIILHRVKFTNVENLRQFVEIGLNHGYAINADEKKMIVDIFREHKNSDGKILTNIFEIANQGYLLNGNYEGYNVIINEE